MAVQITPQSFRPDGSAYPTLGPIWCAWIEQLLRHGEGDREGQPVTLDAFQRLILYRLGEYDPDDVDDLTGTCRLVVKDALIVTPQGCGKTPFASWAALLKLLGPVVPTPDGPVERPSPSIPLVSASLGLTKRLYKFAKDAVESSELAHMVDGPYELEMHRKHGNGTLWRPAASGLLQEGGAPTDVIVEELHTAETNSQVTTIETIVKKVGKRRNVQTIYITTPDDADPESFLGRLMERARRIISGEVVDPSFFVYIAGYGGEPDDLNPDDLDQLTAAVADATPASWVDHRAQVDLYTTGKLSWNDFLRYVLGLFVKREGTVIPSGRWDACAAPPDLREPPPPGTQIVLAFDGSYRRDSTALVGCTLDGYLFVLDIWENPNPKDLRWKVPREEVKAAVADAMDTWEVLELAPDPPGWHEEIDQWRATYGEPPVVDFPTNKITLMSDAWAEFLAAVMEGDLSHDADPRLARHLENAVEKRTRAGVYISKHHPDSPRKIDAAIAAIVAYSRATWWQRHGGDTGGSVLAMVVSADDT